MITVTEVPSDRQLQVSSQLRTRDLESPEEQQTMATLITTHDGTSLQSSLDHSEHLY